MVKSLFVFVGVKYFFSVEEDNDDVDVDPTIEDEDEIIIDDEIVGDEDGA